MTSAAHDPVPQSAERTSTFRGALAGLSLSMLLSSLGTSVANVGLPTLAQALTPPSSRFNGWSLPIFSQSPP